MKWILLVLALFLALIPSHSRAEDALDKVNQVRAERGLHPFKRAADLTIAARDCCRYRMAHHISFHTSNDFRFVPAGSSASAAGCACWPLGSGWGACCTYEDWREAGAWWSKGDDGRQYMHLFVR